MIGEPIDQREYTDGTVRTVYEHATGQFVLDGDEKNYRPWVVSEADFPDLPIIVLTNSDANSCRLPRPRLGVAKEA